MGLAGSAFGAFPAFHWGAPGGVGVRRGPTGREYEVGRLSPDSVRCDGLHPGLLSCLPSGKKGIGEDRSAGLHPGLLSYLSSGK
jgi:hypothetical protein